MKDSLKEWITVCSQGARRNQVLLECTDKTMTCIDIYDLLTINTELREEAVASLRDYCDLKPLFLGTLMLTNKWQTEKQIQLHTQAIDALEEHLSELKKVCDYHYVLEYHQFHHLMKDTLKTDAFNHIKILKEFNTLWSTFIKNYRCLLWLLEEHDETA